MHFNIFDVIVILITLILAVKGFMNGIIKELAGLIGIVLGVYLGGLYYSEAGAYINSSIFKIPNESAINAVGFIAVFMLVWLFVLLVGLLLSKILKIAQLGIVDRIGGVFFSAGKFFILVCVIVTMLMQINLFKEYFSKYEKTSFVFPVMLKIGDKLINLSPKQIKNTISQTKQKIDSAIAPAVKQTTQAVSKQIKEAVQKVKEEQKGE
jgi:membrane protein required for colicin V production